MNNILLIVTGSVSAYKAADIANGLKVLGYNVKVSITDSAKQFITEITFKAFLGNDCIVDEEKDVLAHVNIGKWADAIVVAPASYNFLSNLVYGTHNNFETLLFAALPREPKPIFIFPAMNTNMWASFLNLYYSDVNRMFMHKGLKIFEPRIGINVCGDTGLGNLHHTRDIVRVVDSWLFKIYRENDRHTDTGMSVIFRLGEYHVKGITTDSFSYLGLIDGEVEIPYANHCGAFGARRRHDYHKGIDLYVPEGTLISSIEDGTVVEIAPFTGEAAGCSWWNDTEAIYIQSNKDGKIFVYGEIEVNKSIKVGTNIGASSNVGKVKRVLKKDKGRPTSMLHFEVHEKGFIHTRPWVLDGEKPEGLLDPTLYFMAPYLNKDYFRNFNTRILGRV